MTKKRSTVYVQFKCKDGSSTVAATASMGVMHWFGRITPTKPIENPKPLEVYVVQTGIPFPYRPKFLTMVVAGLERTFGKSPPIPEHLQEAAFYEKLPADLNFQNVEKYVKDGNVEVAEYEQACLDILQWLKEQGEITALIFNEPIQPLGW